MKVEIKIPAPLLPYMSHEEFKSKQNTLLLYPYIANGDISNGKVAELSDFIECRDVCNSQALTILQAITTLRTSENYRILNSNMAQQNMKIVDSMFSSFIGLLKLEEKAV